MVRNPPSSAEDESSVPDWGAKIQWVTMRRTLAPQQRTCAAKKEKNVSENRVNGKASRISSSETLPLLPWEDLETLTFEPLWTLNSIQHHTAINTLPCKLFFVYLSPERQGPDLFISGPPPLRPLPVPGPRTIYSTYRCISLLLLLLLLSHFSHVRLCVTP